jgi:hypothetical protein
MEIDRSGKLQRQHADRHHAGDQPVFQDHRERGAGEADVPEISPTRLRLRLQRGQCD